MDTPIIAVQSEKDEVVSRKSLRYFNNKQNSKVMIAGDSGHYLFSKTAENDIFAALSAFLSGTIDTWTGTIEIWRFLMRYEYILFDLDGTLTDPGPGITNSVMYALANYDIKVADRRELYKFIGPPLGNRLKNTSGFQKRGRKKAVEYYREYYRDKGIFENSVYEASVTCSKGLKGKALRCFSRRRSPKFSQNASWSILVWRGILPVSPAAIWTGPGWKKTK